MSHLDWIIIAAYILVTFGVGVYASRSVASLSDFLVAGRNVRLSLNVATLTSTELAIITVMALAEVGYRQGFSAMTLGLCFFVGVTIVGLTGFIIEPLRQLKVVTIPQFYGMRYHPCLRWIGGVVLSLAGVLNMGVFLKISALFLSRMCGLSSSAVGTVMALMLVVVICYTLVGGRVSVVFMNYFQFLLIVCGCMVATIFAIAATGWNNIVAVVSSEYASGGFNPMAQNDTGWAFILMNTLVFLAVPTVWQPAAACSLSASDPAVARKTILWSGLTFMGRGTIPILWGIAALAYWKTQGAPSGPMQPIEAMPAMFAKVLPVGIAGLFVAALLAADMSTYNSYLLSWSSIISEDVIAPLVGDRWSNRLRLAVNRLLIALIGAFLLWWGLFYEPPSSFFQYQQITGTIYLSGALMCVGCGLYWKRANTAGALAAILVGTLFPIINVLLQPWMHHFPSWLRFLKNGWQAGLVAFLLAFLAMVLGSLLTGKWVRATRLDLAAQTNPPGIE